MEDTKKNLAFAFAGESQANRKYLAFAQKAESDGYPQIAKLFKAAAAAETVHAHNHLKIMGGIKSTIENVEYAIAGETHEYKEMYPEFIEEAKKTEEGRAVWSFMVANQVEEIHAGFYIDALKAVKQGKDLEQVEYYVCQTCGNTVENEPPVKCPICNVSRDKFLKI